MKCKFLDAKSKYSDSLDTKSSQGVSFKKLDQMLQIVYSNYIVKNPPTRLLLTQILLHWSKGATGGQVGSQKALRPLKYPKLSLLSKTDSNIKK